MSTVKLSAAKIVWLLGVLIISTLLYFTILRYPGYIFFYDASGSFDFRRPFDQYLFTYTPYDGIEVGIKNRLPIMSIIALLYSPLYYIFNLPQTDIIKIGYVLLFVGAYSSFYYIFPRFLKIFEKGDSHYERSRLFLWFRLVFSILYVIIPVLTLRLSMLHMFYMTSFYPLIMYVYARMLLAKTVSWKYISLLVIGCFFGFSYTNVLIYYIYSFLIIGITILSARLKNKVEFLASIKSLLIAGIMVILSQIYWILPYIQKGAPTPGYVVTTSMQSALSNHSTISEVLFGASEWFIGQGSNIRVFFTENPVLTSLQLAGILSFYVFVCIYIFTTKQKKLVGSIFVFLIVIIILTISKGNPLYSFVNEYIVYKPFGWIFRETNRMYYLAIFWMYLFFSYGITTLRFKGPVARTFFEKIGELSVLFLTTFLYVVYSIPIFTSVLTFLKPVTLPEDVEEINKILESDKEYSYVLSVPFVDEYALGWAPRKFLLADTINYKYFPYLLNRPSVQVGGVLPVSRTRESLLAEVFLENTHRGAISYDELKERFADIGVKYIVHNKLAIPLYSNEITEEQVELRELFNTGAFRKIYSGKTYDLFINDTFESVYSFELYTTQNVFYNSNYITLKNYSAGIPISIQYETVQPKKGDIVLIRKNDAYFYLDFLADTEIQQYRSFPYDYTNNYGLPVTWGRASAQDKGGAEFSHISRYYDLDVFQYLEDDKIAYSDLPLHDLNNDSVIAYSLGNSCLESCALYAKILYSTRGGVLSFNLGDTVISKINTYSEEPGFFWTYIGTNEGLEKTMGNTLKIHNERGVSAIGSVLYLPQSIVKEQYESVKSTFELRDANSKVQHDIAKQCSISKFVYSNKLIPSIQIKGSCSSEVQGTSLKQFKNEFAYYDTLSQGLIFSETIPVEGNFEGTMYFYSQTDVLLWVLFSITLLLVLIMCLMVIVKLV